MDFKQILSLIAEVATTLGVIIACIQLFDTKREQKKCWEREKKQATLDAYNELQNTVFAFMNEYSPAKIREIAEDKLPEYKVLSGYLAKIEHFCVGLTQGIYDYETFYELSHGYFDGERGMMYARLIPLLEAKGLNAKEDYFANIHEVWRKMAEIQMKRTKDK